MTKVVEVEVKGNSIIRVGNSNEDIDLPITYKGKDLLIWIHDRLEQMGHIINGDNMYLKIG